MTSGDDVRPGRAEDGAELVAAIEKRLSEAAQVLAGGPDRWRLARGEQLLRDVEEVTAACTGMCTDVHLVAALVSVRNEISAHLLAAATLEEVGGGTKVVCDVLRRGVASAQGGLERVPMVAGRGRGEA